MGFTPRRDGVPKGARAPLYAYAYAYAWWTSDTLAKRTTVSGSSDRACRRRHASQCTPNTNCSAVLHPYLAPHFVPLCATRWALHMAGITRSFHTHAWSSSSLCGERCCSNLKFPHINSEIEFSIDTTINVSILRQSNPSQSATSPLPPLPPDLSLGAPFLALPATHTIAPASILQHGRKLRTSFEAVPRTHSSCSRSHSRLPTLHPGDIA